MRVAGVPSRGENLNGVRVLERELAHEAQRLAKSASVSPGKPTMMSVVRLSPGTAARSRATQLAVALGRVAPQHPLEHARRAALHRQVHVLAHLRDLGDRRDHPVAEVVRVRAREADAAHAVDAADRPQQVGEVVRAVVVGVDRLAEQHHLAHPVTHDLLGLAHHVVEPARALEPRVYGTMQYVHR
jgi:hypothetical protein